MSAALKAAQLARKMTGALTFWKKLPAGFGGARILATTRSDIRLLAPGFSKTSSDLFRLVEACIKPGDCVWDIGSNLGIFAFCAAWKAGSQGRVFTVEADPFYAALQFRSARNLSPGYAPVITLCAAVADQFSLLELAVVKRGQTRNHLRIVTGNDAGETESVKQVVTVTADFLLKHWPKPDFIKIDIEGAEELFFAGAGEIFAGARPAIYVEVSIANRDKITKLLLTHK